MTTRRDVWEAFADQFLDTETRTWIPRAAWIAVQAGLSRAEAYDVWRFEVTPAVSANLFDVAGEWAGWDREWLVERIAGTRVRPSTANHVVYRAKVCGFHKWWEAIEACMAALEASGSPDGLVAQLTWLAEHFFDFCARTPAPASKRALIDVYETIFVPIFRPLALSADGAEYRRVTSALARLDHGGPYRTSAA